MIRERAAREQVNWDDVQVDHELPSFSLKIDPLRVAFQASGSQDFYPIHYDPDVARANGLPGVIMNTSFLKGCLARVLTDWIGDAGFLRRLKFEMRRPIVVGDTLTCKGKVTETYLDADQACVDCEVWIENERDGVCVPATATVWLPRR
ncbi:MAG: MaoC family dehydratase N-terminal domain-containing protein [Chloroflexi bacterium]|nr:MaoC family dehydratase N-terminal domain-containing protein [Chloroflexota bacterium]